MKLAGEIWEALTNTHWTVLEEGLSEDELQKLKNMAMDRWQNGHFQPAKVGRSAERKEASDIRSDWTSWIELQDPALSFFSDFVFKLKSEMNQNLYLGLQDFECHFARYASGQSYEEHIDQPRLKSFLHGERVMSFVLYLNENWAPGHGGELQIRNGSDLTRIEPRWGRILLFRSDTVPHAVLPAHHERWSLTGWFRRS